MSNSTLPENQAPSSNGGGNHPEQTIEGMTPQPATRMKNLGNNSPAPNRLLLVLGGLFVCALLLFVFMGPNPPRRDLRRKADTSNRTPDIDTKQGEKPSPFADSSVVPVTDAVTPIKAPQGQALAETDIERTATRTPRSDSSQGTAPGSLGEIPDFSSPDSSRNFDLEPGKSPGVDSSKPEQGTTDAPPSLVFTRRTLPSAGAPSLSIDPGYTLGLPPGFRLRARLESAATTAIRMPVVAVIEYNYERNGTVIIPAGSKAIGHIEQADRSGYLSIHFESLLLPNDGRVPIDGIATDSRLQPLRGRVEGNNAGKQILVRSLSGLGEIGSLLVGRGSLNQPLSESDMLRERIGQNIGQASDQQLTSLNLSQHLIVTLPANTPIYLVLQQASKAISGQERSTLERGSEQQNLDQLRQLLQLQRELGVSQQQ